MPARIARSSLAGPAAKGLKKKNKSAKRSLNAFAIAEAQNTDKHKIRRSRLGQVEDDGPRKRRRMSDGEGNDGEEEDEEPDRKRRSRGDDDDESEESDGEGNRWRMGVVDEDDDSDIDSEEAFGESDEERFEGWTFRGGSVPTKKSVKKRQPQAGEGDKEEGMNLNEEAGEESDDESLGSDAVDLATMLDNYEGSEDEEDGRASGSDKDEESANQSDEDTPPSDYDMSDAEDDNLADNAVRLQNLVSRLHPAEKATKKTREPDAHESRAPSAAGLVSAEKFDINDFLAAVDDPTLKSVSKQLGSLPKTSLSKKKDTKLAPSLPKRQKDRLERVAANEKAKQTLERWVDTVKHQRRAEHLSFPLVDPEAQRGGDAKVFSVADGKPFNELEAAIRNIMQESGLMTGTTNEEEAILRGFEEFATNKLPLEEVQARRAELRKARELLFREEVRAKRVKKIKSKAFRRIKRKEREKLAALDRDAFAEGGQEEMGEEEREDAERKRAEGRMRLKHKDSKWGKEVKRSGRGVWDEGVGEGVMEVARKNEELRRRVEGGIIRDEDGSGDESLESSGEDGDDGDDEDDEYDEGADFRKLQREMQRVEEFGGEEVGGKASRLLDLKFMRDAEARKRKENKQEIARMRRELNGEDAGSDESEDEETSIGRRIFAPNTSRGKHNPETKAKIRGEFEEPDEVQIITEEKANEVDDEAGKVLGIPSSATNGRLPAGKKSDVKSKAATEKKASKKDKDSAVELLPSEKHSQPDADGWVTVTYNDSDREDENEEREDLNGMIDQAEILRRAFAGDDVEDAFDDEKNANIEEDAPQTIDTTLPGWGSWVGTGLSKRDKKKRAPHPNQLKKIEGVERSKRKDAKLKGVVINEKRIKANTRYLANELPHGYGTKKEYEGSIRMPMGGEWNTSRTVGENVKPRVLVKPGAVVRPMERPLL